MAAAKPSRTPRNSAKSGAQRRKPATTTSKRKPAARAGKPTTKAKPKAKPAAQRSRASAAAPVAPEQVLGSLNDINLAQAATPDAARERQKMQQAFEVQRARARRIASAAAARQLGMAEGKAQAKAMWAAQAGRSAGSTPAGRRRG